MPKLLTNIDAASVATIVNLPTPVNPGDAVNKAYVDTVAQGLQPKASVRFTTTGVVALTGLATQAGGDWGSVLTADDRILVKNQSTGTANGIYLAKSGAWVRTSDLPAAAHAKSVFVFAEEGATMADTGWVCTSDAPTDVVGTDPLTFVQFSGAGMITAGDALLKTGNVLDVLYDDTTVGLTTDPTPKLEVKASVRFASHKVTALVGNGTATSFVITHNLGVRTVQVTVREVSSQAIVIADVVATSTAQITVSFITAPAANAYEVTIIG